MTSREHLRGGCSLPRQRRCLRPATLVLGGLEVSAELADSRDAGSGLGALRARSLAEVLVRRSRLEGASDEQHARAGRVGEGELVEGQALATGGEDAGTGGLGEAESADLHLGDGDETLIVQDST